MYEVEPHETVFWGSEKWSGLSSVCGPTQHRGSCLGFMRGGPSEHSTCPMSAYFTCLFLLTPDPASPAIWFTFQVENEPSMGSGSHS